MSELKRYLKYLVNDERKAVNQYAKLKVLLKEVHAPREIIKRIEQIADDEMNHYYDISDILEAIL